MRKSNYALLFLAALTVFWAVGALVSVPLDRYLGLLSLAAVTAILAYGYLRFEEKKTDTRVIAILGTLAAISVAGRVLMAPIPSVQPSTFIIVLSGYVFGPLEGFIVGSTTALVSNFLLGQGPWTPWQMLAWGLVGLASGLLGARRSLESRGRLSAYCASWGFVYGWIVNLYFVLGFVRPITIRAFAVTYAASVWFDALHAAGNFAFAFALGPAMITMLRRYRERFTFEAVGPDGLAPARAPVSEGRPVP